MENQIKITRDNYGSIRNQSTIYGNHGDITSPELDGFRAAMALINAAEKKAVIPAAYDDIAFDRKKRADGTALHHELFDFSRNASIICIRRTEGTRYGVKTLSKTYVLIESYRRKITAREISIPVAKYAKMSILHYGDIIAIAQGKKKIKLLSAIHQVRRGYKAVRVADDGTLVSVWDGSPWVLGKTRVEAARDEHDSGLYYYQSLHAMLAAVAENDIFGAGKPHNRLAILEVEATGVHVCYGHKYAATRITPIRQIASTI